MNPRFCVISDGSCDLPETMIKEKEIAIVPFFVSFDGEHYRKEGGEAERKEFYRQMVESPKTFPKTAAPSPEDFARVFREKVREGQDVICVCISTKLSASLQSAEIAKEMVLEEYPERQIVVLDSLATTMMQGAYVLEICRLRDKGHTIGETVAVMEKLRTTARILFTVGNLEYLRHGGRIGKVTGIAGTLLNVKPLITLKDGEIHSSGICRGRKKSLRGTVELLVNYLREYECGPEDCDILIGYCYDEEEARCFKEMTAARLKEVFGVDVCPPVCRIGAIIGVHAGPYSIGYGVIRRCDRLSPSL